MVVVLAIPVVAAFGIFVVSIAYAIAFSGSTGAEYQASVAGTPPRLIYVLPGAYLCGSCVALAFAASHAERVWLRPVVLAASVGGTFTFLFPKLGAAMYSLALPVLGLVATVFRYG